MRVISGEFRGRKLFAVPGKNTRPTSDKVKESIFNRVGPFFEGGTCLDLYAGSGALAIEAVSRGMGKAVLVEKQRAAVQTIRRNVDSLKADNRFEIKQATSTSMLEELKNSSQTFDLVFLDPPYAEQEIERDILKLLDYKLLSDESMIVCETDKQTQLDERIGKAVLWKDHRYGSSRIRIYILDTGGNDE